MVRTTSTAYTLVELMVVLAVIGVIALIAVFGLNSFSNGQNVENAAKQFVTDMRSLQNQAVNGGISDTNGNRANDGYVYVPGIGSPGTSYTLPSGAIVSLPKGVYIWEQDPQYGLTYTNICFSNPNLSTQPCATVCKYSGINCTSGGYYCNGNYYYCSSSISACFSNNLAVCQKTVNIEGTGWTITRIYEQ